MSEMIERVAKAICGSCPGTGDVNEHFSGEYSLTKSMWLSMSRAAIEAMREPTKAMKACPDFPYCPGEAWAYWEAMIDEALK